jgi:exonuclease VII large subunit
VRKQADNQLKAATKPDKKARHIMIIFTILGFMTDGQRYVDFNFDVRADTPMDAIEKALRQHSNLVVSSVTRSSAVRAR